MGGNRNYRVVLEPRAELTTLFLPRCKNCHAPHPIATKAADPSRCPECGEPAQLGREREESAAIATPLTARIAFAIARAFRALAERIRP